jgi:hypothetical protein
MFCWSTSRIVGMATGCGSDVGRNSELSVHNKLTLYKQVIHPVWSYDVQFWGCASESNIQVIQRYQNKVLKCIVNAP